MKNNFARVFLTISLAAAFLGGCASDGQKYSRTIAVMSDPAGAEIVVNGMPVAKTPLAIEVEATKSGHFISRFEIIARPQADAEGQYLQVKSFAPYSAKDAEKIPEKITFDMRLNPRGN
ncbi:MAG: PEGA domain-containing protein [Opitutales bacterium]|nr:PEGA domain-containing protein [Opitutales bacterium]